MANWAHVVDNQVEMTVDVLPRSWKNVSNLSLLKDDVQTLRSLGWYPVTKQHQEFDPSLKRIQSLHHEFVNDTVVETLVLIDVVADTLSFEIQKQNFMKQLRELRDQKLSDSDKTQLIDVNSQMTDEQKIKWVTYRQQLRDLPETYENNDIVDLDMVVWPSVDGASQSEEVVIEVEETN
jgi:hypothetical protein